MEHEPLQRVTLLRPIVGLRAYLRVMQSWGVEEPEARKLLGNMAAAQVQDALTRVSMTIGICKELITLYGPDLANAWMTLPNSHALFGGSTPIEYVKLNGLSGLTKVRQLLDAGTTGH